MQRLSEAHAAGNAVATGILESYAKAEFFTKLPDVEDEIEVVTFIAGEGDISTDLLSPGNQAHSRSDRELHGQCMMSKEDQQAIVALKAQHPGKRVMLIAEKGEGFSVSRKLEKLGYHGIDSAELVFENYKVSAANLIGGEEGKGFYHAVGGLELGRINVAARGVGIANRALKESVKYSQQRKTFGKQICKHQAIQLKLADMATKCEAARLLVESAAKAYDEGRRCDMEAGMAKYYASEAAVENSLEAMRIHGGYGYSKEFVVERLYRDAPLMTIGEGTNEMQRIIIARQLIERNPI